MLIASPDNDEAVRSSFTLGASLTLLELSSGSPKGAPRGESLPDQDLRLLFRGFGFLRDSFTSFPKNLALVVPWLTFSVN